MDGGPTCPLPWLLLFWAEPRPSAAWLQLGRISPQPWNSSRWGMGGEGMKDIGGDVLMSMEGQGENSYLLQGHKVPNCYFWCVVRKEGVAVPLQSLWICPRTHHPIGVGCQKALLQCSRVCTDSSRFQGTIQILALTHKILYLAPIYVRGSHFSYVPS